MRHAWLVLVLAAACVRPTSSRPKVPPADPFPGSEGDDLGRLRRELEADILDGYARTEAIDPDTWIGMTDPGTGLVRIGVGPDDLIWTRTPLEGKPRRRWPLGDGDARTKLLELHVTDDGSVAWSFDEVSWRLDVCGRVAVIPLRVTALYLRDGERWVPMVEHISYAQPISALVERGLTGARLEGAVAPENSEASVRVAVESALGVRKDADRARTFSAGPDALVLWPDPAHELRGAAVVTGPSLGSAFDAPTVTVEGYRIGIGGGGGSLGASVGWWSGTVMVNARKVDAREVEGVAPVRLRATFVVERADDHWRVVQAHVSAPIRDQDLAAAVFGAARGDDGTLRCDGPMPIAAPRLAPANPGVDTTADAISPPAAPPATTRPATRSASGTP